MSTTRPVGGKSEISFRIEGSAVCDHRLVEYVYNTPWSPKTFDGRETRQTTGCSSWSTAAGWTLAAQQDPTTMPTDVRNGIERILDLSVWLDSYRPQLRLP